MASHYAANVYQDRVSRHGAGVDSLYEIDDDTRLAT